MSEEKRPKVHPDINPDRDWYRVTFWTESERVGARHVVFCLYPCGHPKLECKCPFMEKAISWYQLGQIAEFEPYPDEKTKEFKDYEKGES